MLFLEVDPSTVKPGWTPLIITVLLAAAIALLMISMRRQIRKISVPHRDGAVDTGAEGTGSPGAVSDGGAGEAAEPDGTSETGGPTHGGTAGNRHPISHG